MLPSIRRSRITIKTATSKGRYWLCTTESYWSIFKIFCYDFFITTRKWSEFFYGYAGYWTINLYAINIIIKVNFKLFALKPWWCWWSLLFIHLFLLIHILIDYRVVDVFFYFSWQLSLIVLCTNAASACWLLLSLFWFQINLAKSWLTTTGKLCRVAAVYISAIWNAVVIVKDDTIDFYPCTHNQWF